MADPRCPGSLASAPYARRETSIACPSCGRAVPFDGPIELEGAVTRAVVPEHEPMPGSAAGTRHRDPLAAGRRAALDALRAERGDLPRQTQAMVLSEICLELGLQLGEELCAHPRIESSGECFDCGMEPAGDADPETL